MASNNGFIKLSRSILDWQWWGKDGHAQLFVYLILRANYEYSCWQGVKIERGQLITSYDKIAKDNGLSVQNVRTIIKHLISTGEITFKSTNKYSVITICNYDSYQSRNDETNKQSNKQPNIQLTSNQQATNNIQEYKEEYNNNKNIESGVVQPLSQENYDALNAWMNVYAPKFRSLPFPPTYEVISEIARSFDHGSNPLSDMLKDGISECEKYLENPTGSTKVNSFDFLKDKLTHKGYKRLESQ